MDFAALTDLEWLLRDGATPEPDADRERAVVRRVAKERGVEPTELRARLDVDRDLRSELALGWLDAVRARREDLPGPRIAHGLDVAGWILVILGLLIGGGTSKVLLHYDGSTPVNVLWFVFVLCIAQILFLGLMLWFVLRARKPASGGGPGVLHRPVAAIAARFFGVRGQAISDALRAMRVRRGLYADVERWTLFALAQRFGVAFNVGAIAVAFATIAFSDLVFSWSTTLDVTPETVHTGARAISLPWSWLPDWVPSLEVVVASQWARMPGEFVARIDNAPQLAAQWWPFLIAGVVTWGLVPRLVALFAGSWRARRALAAAGFDHIGYQELFDRLLPPRTGWQGPRPEDVEGSPPAPTQPGDARRTEHAPVAAGAPTWLLLWGSIAKHADVVAQQLTARTSADVQSQHAVGGADLRDDQRALDSLRGAEATRVTFVAAVGQQPTADVLEFLRNVRQTIGATKPVVVGLLGVDDGSGFTDATDSELEQWRRSLGALDDPHLWAERMGDRP